MLSYLSLSRPANPSASFFQCPNLACAPSPPLAGGSSPPPHPPPLPRTKYKTKKKEKTSPPHENQNKKKYSPFLKISGFQDGARLVTQHPPCDLPQDGLTHPGTSAKARCRVTSRGPPKREEWAVGRQRFPRLYLNGGHLDTPKMSCLFNTWHVRQFLSNVTGPHSLTHHHHFRAQAATPPV